MGKLIGIREFYDLLRNKIIGFEIEMCPLREGVGILVFRGRANKIAEFSRYLLEQIYISILRILSLS